MENLSDNNIYNSFINVGQIWEDKDKRRTGRTFKIRNIDNLTNQVTVEVLTGAGGKEPDSNNLISFIKLSRFKNAKYYKLKKDVVKTFSARYDEYKEDQPDTIDVISKINDEELLNTTIVVRKPYKDPSCLEKCKEAWPGDWKDYDRFAVLAGDSFEIHVRQERHFSNMHHAKIKINNFVFFETTVGDLNSCLKLVEEKLFDAANDIAGLMHS